MTARGISLRGCIEDLSARNTDYKFPDQAINQAESLKSLSSDLYTDNIRFIYELIQNADDAQAKNVIVTILEDKYFVITHDGNIFNEKDLQGLCGVNNGTKKKDLTKTGYKGLGFKAVFGKSDHVLIYSNGEYFRFDSAHKIKWNQEWGTEDQQIWEERNDRKFIYPWQINPVWTNESDVPLLIRNFYNQKKKQIHVAYAVVLDNVGEIYSAMSQLKLQPYMFLFLRNISQITFLTQSNDTVSIALHSDHGLKQIYINKRIDSQWIIRRIELNVPDDIREKMMNDTKAPEKLRSLKSAEIFFAAKSKDSKLDGNGKVISDGIEKLRDQDSILFSYLPTKISEYKFPVLINANFLTNVNREQIHTDSSWNQWLFEKIGSEIFQWIKELVQDKKVRYQAYRLIPSKLNLTNNILSKRFNDTFFKAIQDCNFILNRKIQLLKVHQAIMDLTSMSKQESFINADSMRQYVINNDKHRSQFSDCPFIDYDSNLKQIGVYEFTWHQCIDMFRSDVFLQTHSIDQNMRMIDYFHSRYSTEGSFPESGIDIKHIPFLMDQNNRLQLVSDIYFPAETIGDSGTSDSEELFVNRKIFDWLNEKSQRGIKQWLQNLGVEERTDLTFLRKTIIPNASTYSTADNAVKTIRMLFMLFQRQDIEKKELNELKKLKLLTTSGALVVAEQCFFSDQYKPRLPLEEHLKTKEDKFLSFGYVISDNQRKENDDLADWRRFFMMFGVQEELHPIVYYRKLTSYEAAGCGFSAEYLSQSSPDGKHTIDAFSRLATISFIEHTLSNHEFAKFFWSYVVKYIKTEALMQTITVYWGHSSKRGAIDGTPADDADYVTWFIQNTRCIPTTAKTCELASTVFANSRELEKLCGSYMCFSSISLPLDKTNWHSIFNFKTKLSANDYFDLLEKIRHDEKNLKENIARIQLIYSHILKEMYYWPSDERQAAKARVRSLYLLSESDQWKLASDLYLYSEGSGTNNSLNDAIPCLKLDYDNRKQSRLHEFLDFLNIKQIRMNDLSLAHEQSSPADNFRRKLIEISPFLKKWLENLSVSLDIISTVDKKIQQDNDFIESARLPLFYNRKFVQETNVYYDSKDNRLYVRRPWNSETTFMDLPYKLCLLLNIRGFDQNIRFLLKGTIDEIKDHFKRNTIEIPTKEDIVILPSVSKPEVVRQPKASAAPSVVSKKSAAPLSEAVKPDSPDKNREPMSNKRENTAITVEIPFENSNTRVPDANSVLYVPLTNPNYPCHYQVPTYGMVPRPIQEVDPVTENSGRSIAPHFIPSQGEQTSSMELIDISSITTSNSLLFQGPIDQSIDNEGFDLATGREGEEMVCKYLLHKYRGQLNSVSITWINEHRESTLPYDIRLTINGKIQYIEVKSTRTYSQHMFSLSINQIESFLQYRENYFIYRVYIEENKLLILDNIRWRLIQKQQLACFLRILPVPLDQAISMTN